VRKSDAGFDAMTEADDKASLFNRLVKERKNLGLALRAKIEYEMLKSGEDRRVAAWKTQNSTGRPLGIC
jgi:hypothetical protein